MTDAIRPAPIWKRVVAPIFDIMVTFFGFGFAIAYPLTRRCVLTG